MKLSLIFLITFAVGWLAVSANELNEESYSFELPADWSSVRSTIDTSFSCVGRSYGYYADVYNDCQLYHVCNPREENGQIVYSHSPFLCSLGTVFDQRSQTCVHQTPDFSCVDSVQHYGETENRYADNSVNEISNVVNSPTTEVVVNEVANSPPVNEHDPAPVSNNLPVVNEAPVSSRVVPVEQPAPVSNNLPVVNEVPVSSRTVPVEQPAPVSAVVARSNVVNTPTEHSEVVDIHPVNVHPVNIHPVVSTQNHIVLTQQVEPTKTIQAPVKQVVQAPVKQVVQAPVKQVVQTPVKQVVQAPVKQVVQTPVKQVVQAPVKQVVQTPVKQVVQAPVKQVVQTPVKQVVQAPVKQIVTQMVPRKSNGPIKQENHVLRAHVPQYVFFNNQPSFRHHYLKLYPHLAVNNPYIVAT